ncbi:hypothetical protein PROFUN_16131, partial [Planoprotostelium fungivorum]
LVTITALYNKYKLRHKVPGLAGLFCGNFRFDISFQVFGNDTSPTCSCNSHSDSIPDLGSVFHCPFEDPSSISLGFESVSSTVHSPWATIQAIHEISSIASDLVHHIPSPNTATSNIQKVIRYARPNAWSLGISTQTMAFIYRPKNGDATDQYSYPSAQDANVLASKFPLNPSSIAVYSDPACRTGAGNLSTIAPGTYYVDGTAAQTAPAGPLWGSMGLYGALRTSQALARTATALRRRFGCVTTSALLVLIGVLFISLAINIASFFIDFHPKDLSSLHSLGTYKVISELDGTPSELLYSPTTESDHSRVLNQQTLRPRNWNKTTR